MLQCDDDLRDVNSGLVLCEAALRLLLDNFREIAARTILEDQEQVAPSLEAFFHLDDERVAGSFA